MCHALQTAEQMEAFKEDRGVAQVDAAVTLGMDPFELDAPTKVRRRGLAGCRWHAHPPSRHAPALNAAASLPPPCMHPQTMRRSEAALPESQQPRLYVDDDGFLLDLSFRGEGCTRECMRAQAAQATRRSRACICAVGVMLVDSKRNQRVYGPSAANPDFILEGHVPPPPEFRPLYALIQRMEAEVQVCSLPWQVARRTAGRSTLRR